MKILVFVFTFLAFYSEVKSVNVLESVFIKLGTYADGGCNNKVYYLSRHLRGNFLSAHNFCKSFGMNLATFPTQNEYNAFRSSAFRNVDAQSQYFLVGGTRTGGATWYWFSSGTEINYLLDWESGAPSNPTTEQCLAMVGRNFVQKWNDVMCDSVSIRFVCEKFL